MFVVAGLFAAMAGLAGNLFPAVRYAEDILPDHDVARPKAVEAQLAAGF